MMWTFWTAITNRNQYGRVERVYIDRHGVAPKVFVKFTNQLSALRVSTPVMILRPNANPIAGCKCIGGAHLQRQYHFCPILRH